MLAGLDASVDLVTADTNFVPTDEIELKPMSKVLLMEAGYRSLMRRLHACGRAPHYRDDVRPQWLQDLESRASASAEAAARSTKLTELYAATETLMHAIGDNARSFRDADWDAKKSVDELTAPLRRWRECLAAEAARGAEGSPERCTVDRVLGGAQATDRDPVLLHLVTAAHYVFQDPKWMGFVGALVVLKGFVLVRAFGRGRAKAKAE